MKIKYEQLRVRASGTLGYDPQARHSSLFSREHTMAALFLSFTSCSEALLLCASISFSLFRVNWIGLAAGFVLR